MLQFDTFGYPNYFTLRANSGTRRTTTGGRYDVTANQTVVNGASHRCSKATGV